MRHIPKRLTKFILPVLCVIPFLASCKNDPVLSTITPDVSNAIAACTAGYGENLRLALTARTPTAYDVGAEIRRTQNGGDVGMGGDTNISLEKYKLYLECMDKILRSKVADNPCQDAICVDIVREADFSKSGCNPNGTKKDIVVYSDTITLSKDDAQYTAKAFRLRGMDVQLFDLSNPSHKPVPTVYPRATKNPEVEELTWNIPVKDRTVRLQTVWDDANLTDPGIGFYNNYIIKNISATIKLPSGIAIQAGTLKVDNPEVALKCTLQPTISCKDLFIDRGVDISWKWNMWENCGKSAAPTKKLRIM